MFERTRGRIQLQAMKRLVKRVPRSKRAKYLDELMEIERKYVRSMDAAEKVQGLRNKRREKSRAFEQLVRDSEDLKARYRVDYSWKERFKSPYTLGGIGLLVGLGLGLGLTFGLPTKEVEIHKPLVHKPSKVEVKTLDELVERPYKVESVDVTKGVTIDGRYRDVLNVQVEDGVGTSYMFKIAETDPEVFERLALYFIAVKEKDGTIEIPDPLYEMASKAAYPGTSKKGIKFGIQLDEYGNPVYCFEGNDIMFNFIARQPLEEYMLKKYIKEEFQKYPLGIEFDDDF